MSCRTKQFSTGEIQTGSKHFRKCLIPLIIIEMQIKATWRVHPTSVRVPLIRISMVVKAGVDVGEGRLFRCWWK